MSCEKISSNCILQLNMNVNISWWIDNDKINYVVNSSPVVSVLSSDQSLSNLEANDPSFNRYDKYTIDNNCEPIDPVNKNNSNTLIKDISKETGMKFDEYEMKNHLIDNSSEESNDEIDDENESNNESTGDLIDDVNDKNSYIVTPMYVRTLFPFSKDIVYENLKLTEVGLYSISNRHDSGTLTRILNQCILSWNLKTNSIVITDGTAGIGGNSIAFGMMFKQVNAIEIDNIQYNALVNNMDVYNLKNVKCYFGNCLKIIPLLDQHIIFLDPPWGGKLYKKVKKLDLFLSGIPLVHVTNQWKQKCKNLEMIAIKIPKNFSLHNFAKECEYPFLYLLFFRKYNVLILSNRICKPIEHRHFQGYIKNRRNSI